MSDSNQLKMDFEKAIEQVKTLKARPSDAELLELYALYKQAKEGDVSGSRPGLLNLKGRAKYDAWAKIKGTDESAAMNSYIGLVKSLLLRS